MKTNPLLRIQEFGQSIWLDFISRDMLVSGDLKRLIDLDGLRGVTSNPAIFEKAISETEDYATDIAGLAREGKTAAEIYEVLVVKDIQLAADILHPVFLCTEGRDGFVSLEVSPLLARDTEMTVSEAHHWWVALNRPNVFIKVPATKEGLPAITQLISDGINVNVTLLFGLDRYREVAEAYITGLEARAAAGLPIDKVASVASFFLSRIDTLIDPLIEKVMTEGGSRSRGSPTLRGAVAIASAKIAFQIYQEIFFGDRFRALAQEDARTQRVLWASTSTKNPSYSDVKYVDALIGPDTVNTLPLETLNAYRDHGDPAARLEEDLDLSRRILDLLPEIGIELAKVAQQLEEEGIQKFSEPFGRLMTALERRRQDFLAPSGTDEPRSARFASPLT